MAKFLVNCRETERGTEPCKKFICLSEKGRVSGGEQLHRQLVPGASGRVCTHRKSMMKICKMAV